jgi:hypothetical protein
MKINENQKMILYIAIVVMVLMVLFPPMVFTVSNVNWGYHFISELFSSSAVLTSLSINMMQLVAQWVGVAIVGGIAFLLAGDKRKT